MNGRFPIHYRPPLRPNFCAETGVVLTATVKTVTGMAPVIVKIFLGGSFLLAPVIIRILICQVIVIVIFHCDPLVEKPVSSVPGGNSRSNARRRFD